MQECTIETLYYCIYEDESATVADWACRDNLLCMNEGEAVGCWQVGEGEALSARLAKRGNLFDGRRSWRDWS
jgi:hypothetical protein